MLILFGVDDLTALSGGSGWLGAGLLGLVLSWLLLIHLPKKDLQLEVLLGRKDTQINAVIEAKNAQLSVLLASRDQQQKMMHEENQKQLDLVIEHCKTEMTGVQQLFAQKIEHLDRSIVDLCESIQRLTAKT